MIQSLLIGNINDFVVSPPSVLRTATSPRQAGGGFRVRRLVLQILPALVSGEAKALRSSGGTAGHGSVLEERPLAAELWRAKHALRSCPSVSASHCHLPQTSWGRILELSLSRIILPELVSGRGTAAAGGGGGAFDV